MKYPEMGLYNKFVVRRTDGQSEEGEKHHNCQYFVLDVSHDPFALAALEAYANACQKEFPALAKDLYHEVALQRLKELPL